MEATRCWSFTTRVSSRENNVEGKKIWKNRELIWYRVTIEREDRVDVSSKVNPIFFSLFLSNRSNEQLGNIFIVVIRPIKRLKFSQKHPRRNNGRTKAVAITLIYVFGWIIFFELFVANLHVVTIRATTSRFLSLSLLIVLSLSLLFLLFFLSPFIFFSPLATSFDNGGSGNILNNVTSFRPSASRNRGI